MAYKHERFFPVSKQTILNGAYEKYKTGFLQDARMEKQLLVIGKP